MRILGCRFGDEDGTIIVEWYEEREHDINGGVMMQTILTVEAQQNWEHVGYYATELRQDLEELVAWSERYRKGTVT